MELILEFFKNFIFEIIYTIIFSSGVLIFFTRKMRRTIDAKSVGIKCIHKRGKDVKHLQNSVKKSKQIKMISFMPFYFVFDHKEQLVKKIREGCSIKFLVCNKDMPLLKDLCQIERHVDNDIANLFEQLINLLSSIKKDAGDDATGSIEVRTYNTEIRNPATICYEQDEHISAYLTVSTPPKRSIDVIMLEYADDDCQPIIDYFDAIWNRHCNDVVLKLK